MDISTSRRDSDKADTSKPPKREKLSAEFISLGAAVGGAGAAAAAAAPLPVQIGVGAVVGIIGVWGSAKSWIKKRREDREKNAD